MDRLKPLLDTVTPPRLTLELTPLNQLRKLSPLN